MARGYSNRRGGRTCADSGDPKRLPRMSIALAALVGAMMMSSGCMVGPDYVKPKLQVPAAYEESEGWKVAQPQDEAARGKWWEIYGDPQLNALEEQVDISNQTWL